MVNRNVSYRHMDLRFSVYVCISRLTDWPTKGNGIPGNHKKRNGIPGDKYSDRYQTHREILHIIRFCKFDKHSNFLNNHSNSENNLDCRAWFWGDFCLLKHNFQKENIKINGYIFQNFPAGPDITQVPLTVLYLKRSIGQSGFREAKLVCM